MKTTLSAGGQIAIPPEICEKDNLVAGDAFNLERLIPGHYLLAKRRTAESEVTVTLADDSLPVIRGGNGVITSTLVKEIESATP
jgi:hypothetical protein